MALLAWVAMGSCWRVAAGCAHAPSGWPARWWWPRLWHGLFTTPPSSATGSTLRAGLTPPRPSRFAPRSPGFPPHPGWHNPWVALLFYVKAAELDAAAGLGQRAAGAELCWGRYGPGSRRAAEPSPGRCCYGFRCRSTPTPLPMVQCPSFFPSGGRTPGTTRATAWNCCPLWRWDWALPRSLALAQSREFKPRWRAGTRRPCSVRIVALNAWQMLRERPLVYVEGTKNIERAGALRDRDSAGLAGASRKAAGRRGADGYLGLS